MKKPLLFFMLIFILQAITESGFQGMPLEIQIQSFILV